MGNPNASYPNAETQADPASVVAGNLNSKRSGQPLRRASALGVCLCWLGIVGCTTSTPHEAAKPAQLPPPEKPSAAPAKAVESADATLKALAAAPVASFEGEGWQEMFDGRSLTGWHETKFSGHGEVQPQDGVILLKMGDPFTGIDWTNGFPKMNYEIAFDAMRLSGSDFFSGLTVPVGDSFCSLIVGGWGGALVGISSLDGMDASENETTKYETFLQNHWYRIRLRVTQDRIEGWIDQEKLIDVVTTGKRISLRPGEIEESKPLGIACWQTGAALRHIKFRAVDQPADPPKKGFR
jgi:hypothetical protein